MADRDNFDTLTPECRVKIDGRYIPEPAMADLMSLCVLDDIEAASMFHFTVASWDGVEMKMKWVDEDLFKEGRAVELEMGYRDALETLFWGEITGLEPEFPRQTPPKLTVRGYDRRHRLMRKHRSQTFLNMKDSDIASQIATDAGLTPEVEDTQVTFDYLLQHNQTDLEFLQSRARRIDYDVVVVDRTLRFRQRRITGSAELRLNREVELLEFYPRLSTMGQVEDIQVRGWDPSEKKEIVGRAACGDEARMSGSTSGPATTARAFGGTGGTAVDSPVQSETDANQVAGGLFSEMALRYVLGEGVCIGRPDLRAGMLVEIVGLGERFSGTYYVTSTQHTYDPRTGYRTAFTVRRNDA